MFEYLQRIGRSLMVPIAVLPVAALLLRLGSGDMLNLPFIAAAGSAILDNIALLFAIGIAIGMSDDHRGEAVLAAVVGYLVLIASTQALLTATYFLGAGYAADDEIVTRLSSNVLVGVAAGLIAVWTYNRFRETRLPSVLSFFSGRRLAPILTPLFVLVPAVLLRFIWPPFWNGLNAFGAVLFGWGAYGAAAYGVLNRLLTPFGLHHVLNSYLWFGAGSYTTPAGETVVGDIPRFLSGDPTAGVYQVGFYPIMMFGLVGAALAMIVLAKKSERAKMVGILGSAALISLVTGITEPIEFAFLFAAPLLYLFHALLTGISMLVTNLMGLRHGFGFSAGLIDYLVNFYLAERPIDLLVVGVVFFAAYFAIFYVAIRALNLMTPGRETAEEVTSRDLEIVMAAVSQADDQMTAMAKGYVRALGGANNVVEVDSCETRLRLTVKDSDLVSAVQLANLGAKGVVKPSSTAVQVAVGIEAGEVASAIRDALHNGAAPVLTYALPPDPRDALAPRSAPLRRSEPYIDDPAVVASVNLMIKALGGGKNILDVSAIATTRVRVVVADPQLVDEDAIRAAGASGVMTMGDTYHLLLGMRAQAYGAEMEARRFDEAAA